MEIERIVDLPTTAEAAWSVLLNFDNYDRWTRLLSIEGKPLPMGEATYVLMMSTVFSNRRAFRVEGFFTTVDAPTRLEFGTGIARVMWIWFGYHIVPIDHGVNLKLYCGVSGFLGFLLKRKFSKSMTPVLELLVDDLSRHICGKGPAPSMAPNRRQRRRAEHRQSTKVSGARKT